MFRKKTPEPQPPTQRVVVKVYDLKMVKSARARLEALSGFDDKSVIALAALAELDANDLAGYGYEPVSHAMTGSISSLGPILTVIFMRRSAPLT